jgi:hypothetical protein
VARTRPSIMFQRISKKIVDRSHSNSSLFLSRSIWERAQSARSARPMRNAVVESQHPAFT